MGIISAHEIDEGRSLTNEDIIKIPNEILVKYDDDENPGDCLINEIFPFLKENAHMAKYITERAILATTNDNVDILNEKLIEMFPMKSKTYYCFDSVIDDTQNYYQDEFLNTLTPNGLPPHKLVLNNNCLIMLLRNLNPSNGLCNGTRIF